MRIRRLIATATIAVVAALGMATTKATPAFASGIAIQTLTQCSASNCGTAQRLCLDDLGYGGIWNQVGLWYCNGQSNQDWRVFWEGKTTFILKNAYNGLCLDDKYAGIANGTPAILYTCSGTDPSQIFTFGTGCQGCEWGAYVLGIWGNGQSNWMTLDVPSNNPYPGLKEWFWANNGSPAQQFSWPNMY